MGLKPAGFKYSQPSSRSTTQRTQRRAAGATLVDRNRQAARHGHNLKYRFHAELALLPSSITATPELIALEAAASAGSAEAMFQLATLYARGSASASALALHWYRRAAECGFPPAQYECARWLLYGLAGPQEPATALEFLLRAERAGLAAASDLLLELELGGVVDPGDQRGDARLSRALEAGYAPALLTAALYFGRHADPHDQARCVQLLQRLSQGGHAIGAALLAERLRRGEGCEPNLQLAQTLDSELARAGFARLAASSSTAVVSAPTPPGQINLRASLHPAPARELAKHPHVAVIDGVLSSDECRLLMASARPHLRESQVTDPQTGKTHANPIRSSRHATFDPVLESSALKLIQCRLANAAGVALAQCEFLAVLHYQPGQQYRPHRDFLPRGALALDRPAAGNRLRTLCVYLNDVQAGGETTFPKLGLQIQPIPGRAIVFDNLSDDGKPLEDSLHAGLPVLTGEKWLATLWIRQARYREM